MPDFSTEDLQSKLGHLRNVCINTTKTKCFHTGLPKLWNYAFLGMKQPSIILSPSRGTEVSVKEEGQEKMVRISEPREGIRTAMNEVW